MYIAYYPELTISDMDNSTIKHSFDVANSGKDVWECYIEENNTCRTITFAIVCVNVNINIKYCIYNFA
jgi:hypothetical protein